MNCLICGIEFEPKRKDAKTCSRNCRVTLSRKGTNVTDNVTLSSPDVTLNFQFTVSYNRKPGDLGYDIGVEEQRKRIRTAKYWYDVPLAALPVIQKDWPKMESYMNGRQYFLWWKNEFKVNEDGQPIIHNPFPVRDNVRTELAGESARRWGA